MPVSDAQIILLQINLEPIQIGFNRSLKTSTELNRAKIWRQISSNKRLDAAAALAQIRQYENSTLMDDTRIVRDGLLASQDSDATNQIVREYTWGVDMGGGIGGLFNIRNNATDYAYLYDGKGNVSVVVDTGQSVAAAYRYDSFGKLMSKSGTLDQPFQFSTKRYLSGIGLSYCGYRYYSASSARWMTRDPIKEAGGINLYGFVHINPVNLLDPFGLNSNPCSNLPSFVDAFPNSDFAAPVADIILGGLEAGVSVAAGAAAISFIAGPEFWWITLPTAPLSLETGGMHIVEFLGQFKDLEDANIDIKEQRNSL